MRALLTLLILGMTAWPAHADNDLASFETKNRQLKAEYELAGKPRLYVVFDLAKQQIHFKSSGVAVATLDADEMRLWGRPTVGQSLSIAKAETLNPPEREKIIPSGKDEPQRERPKPAPKTAGELPKFEIKALELNDMPQNYDLVLSDGLRIVVRTVPEGEQGEFKAIAEKAYWYLSRPLITQRHYLQKKTYNEIFIRLPPKEARMIYWSFADDTPCLIQLL